MREVAHLEQLETRSDTDRHPAEWQLATAYLGLVPTVADPSVPEDTAWHPVDDLPPMAFDHESITLSGRERLRAKLSYTNIGFALAPETFTISELRVIYAAALGHTRVGDQSAARAAPAAGARADRRAAPARSRGREAGGRVPLPLARARGDRPVRGAQATGLAASSWPSGS